MTFWSALFGGQNTTLNKTINATGNIGGFSQNQGQSNTAKGSKFWSDITSGDQSKIAKTLGPEFAAIQGGLQQQKNTTAEFSNRSGGNNSAMQSAGDKARAEQKSLTSGLLAHGADALLSSGQNLLSTALSAFGQQADMSQMQMQNWQNSILGRSVTGVADTLTSAATGGIAKIPGLRNFI